MDSVPCHPIFTLMKPHIIGVKDDIDRKYMDTNNDVNDGDA